MATRKKAAPKPDPEEVEDDLELEELDDETPDEAPAAKVEEEVWGVRQLIELIKVKLDKEYTPREVRTLLRKMARDGSGRVDREIVAGNKTRYAWSGANDPEVKEILKAVKAGDIEAGKKEALDALKASKAAKDGTKPKATKKRTRKAPTPPPVDEDDDDLEEFDEDDD